MLKLRNTRRWVVLVIGVVAAGVVAGAVVAARLDVGVPADLEAALHDDPLVQVAGIPAENGLAGRGVFVQRTSAGFTCLWDAPSATSSARQGGCNRTDDPFGGRELFVSLAYDGGPAITSIKDARLVGLAAAEVAEVQVLMSDGARRAIRLRKSKVEGDEYRAFGYRFKKADLRIGVSPQAVIALDAIGEEIDRQPTGFSG